MTRSWDDTAPDLRERLRDGQFLALARDTAPTGVRLRSAEELESSLQDILRQHTAGDDLHVFGYGSLMWNPAVDHVAAVQARVYGWHRCFCIRSLFGRGAPDAPGLMLALDRGGSCSGVVLRIAADKVDAELSLLWRREMPWGSYHARWVTAWGNGTPVRAVTFVVDRRHPRYMNNLSPCDAAGLIRTGQGRLGTCRQYFDATLQKLRALGIRDGAMERLDALLRG